jgi:hypothetical protein
VEPNVADAGIPGAANGHDAVKRGWVAIDEYYAKCGGRPVVMKEEAFKQLQSLHDRKSKNGRGQGDLP